MWLFFNPTIVVVTFHLRRWCMLGVFLLLAFTCLGHECQGLLSPCDGMYVRTDWTSVYTLIQKSFEGMESETMLSSREKIPCTESSEEGWTRDAASHKTASPMHCGLEKTIIKSLSKKKWKQQHPNYNQSDCLHKLNRPEQVILFRLRTGHSRLNAHMYKFKVGESEMRPYNTDIMTAEHLLQLYRLHDCFEVGHVAWTDAT